MDVERIVDVSEFFERDFNSEVLYVCGIYDRDDINTYHEDFHQVSWLIFG